jgi:hypothetical protein
MSDRAILGGAIMLSVALHLGALAFVSGREAPAVEGGAVSAQAAALGNSFRDIAQGSVAAQPSPPPDRVAPTRPDGPPPEPIPDRARRAPCPPRPSAPPRAGGAHQSAASSRRRRAFGAASTRSNFDRPRAWVSE